MTTKLRNKLLKRSGYKCENCGSSDNLQIDHCLPVSLGGTDDVVNLRVLCRGCNIKRNDSVLLTRSDTIKKQIKTNMHNYKMIIEDVKFKLLEKNKQVLILEYMIERLQKIMQQQLAEKDKQIDRLLKENELYITNLSNSL